MGIVKEVLLDYINESQNNTIKTLKEDKKKTNENYIKESKRANNLFKLSYERKLKIEQLQQMLEECTEYLSDVDEFRTKNADECYLLLTRINEVLK